MRGREQHVIGMIAAVSEAQTAASLSIGGAPKRYAHADPNEDAAAFAYGAAGTLLAVADAHDGFEASEVLIEHLLANAALHWVDEAHEVAAERWPHHAHAVLCDANAEILRERRMQESGHSSTTLTLAVLRPRAGLLLHAAIGDSHLFLVDASGGVREVASAAGTSGRSFLGADSVTVDALARRTRMGATSLAGVRAVALVTDGLSAEGIGSADPAATVAEAAAAALYAKPELRALCFAREIAERALAAQRGNRAGDNVAAAVAWLAGSD